MAGKKGEGKPDPIIITKKVQISGAHGGAWKVAYADFVTAMMAFFLLLWLLNATTSEQRSGVADYFAPPAASLERSGAGGPGAGQDVMEKGALPGRGAPTAVTIPLPNPPSDPSEGDYEGTPRKGMPGPASMSDDVLRRAMAKEEEERFSDVARQLRANIAAAPELAQFSENIKIDQTDEGLRVQLVDQSNASMFPPGSSQLYDQTRQLLRLVAQVLAKLPNKMVIKGHTDTQSLSEGGDRSNWELSGDRANATRRSLLDAGFPPERIAEVVGLAGSDPLEGVDPASPRNRRISLVLVREALPAL
jgi:chemotaxis protein MotB